MFENAKWILPEKSHGNAPVIYRRIIKPAKSIKSATLNVTACGVYEAFIDGVKTGKNVLAPGFTVYPKHHLYQAYDVTKLLASESELTVSVAAGWYAGGIARKHFPLENGFSLIAELDIIYSDGEKESIVTSDDGTWLCGTGKILDADIYNGEVYDARITPVLDGKVCEHKLGKSQLTLQEGEDVVEHDVFAPIAKIITPVGETVIDFGCNITGYPFFEKLHAKEGEVVDLSFAEVLDKDGNFYNANYRKAACRFSYTCRDGVQSFKPHHTYYGFRYVRVNSFPENAEPLDILRATDVYSDINRRGSFECGVELVNKLFGNVIRGQKGNFLDLPTDCPQRDERLGWTGDAQVFCKTAMFNFGVEKFFTKWLHDMIADQAPDGEIGHTVPDIGWGYGAAAWSDAVTIIPWTMYVMYGNKDILREMLPAMRKYVDGLHAFGSDTYLLKGKEQPYGDWLGLDDPSGKTHVGATDKEYIGAVFFSYSALLTAKAMEAVGEDGSEYFELHDKIVDAIRREYDYKTYNTQTACVLALHFGIATDENRAEIAAKLAELIHERGDSLTTGFVGTPYLLHALSENGYTDLAYTLLLRKDYPSWLYPVTKGATTIWEHWDGVRPDGSMWDVGMNSYNHYAYGSVADWMYGVVCGIVPCEDENAGFAKIKLAPNPDKRLGYAKASYMTKYGKLVSEWKYENDKVVYRSEIPEGMTAELTIDGKSELLTGGTYER